MTSQFDAVGAQPRNPSRGKPIHIARLETGLATNRSPLHDPASWYQSKYGGFPDALIDGSNMEVSNQLTLVRRPGLSQWSSVSVPDQINSFYDWRTLTCGPKVVVDTTTSTYIQSAIAQNLIFTKSALAGQGYYQGVANTLYYGDGVDLQKFILGTDCIVSNGKTWNWGIAGPSTAPTVTSAASGSAATVWQANTFFTTMGLTVDTNGNIWQLIGVNADLSNTPNAQFGTAGNGSPSWNQSIYGTTTEGAGTPIVWKNLGQLQPWQASFQYGDAGFAGTAAPVGIYDPNSQSIYLNFNHSGGLSQSGTVKPSFTGAVGSSFWDNGCHWFFYATYPGIGSTQVQPWKSSHAYTAWYGSGGANGNNESCIEPFLFPPPNSQPIYLQVPTNAGTSGNGYAPFPASPVIGQQQPDGQLNWLCLGSSTWTASHTYAAWTAQGTPFGCIKDTNTNMQVCVQTGNSASVQPGTSATLTAASNASGGNTTYTGTFPTPFLAGSPAYISGFTTSANNGTFTVVSCNATTLVLNNANGVAETHAGTAIFNQWGTTYGSTITDGTVKWVCVGPQTTWVAGSGTTGIWNLPPSGWAPPTSSQNFGGSLIDSNTALVEATVVSGKSGTVQPTWSALGNYTNEGPAYVLTSVAVSNGTVTYNGTITGGAANAYAGLTFFISGFTSFGNNGFIHVTASTATTLVCELTSQSNETHAASAATGLIWFAESNVVTVGLTSTKGFFYAYSYEARLSTDIYNTTTPPGGGQLGNPGALGTPTGSESGGVSTASPTTFIGPELTSSVNTISGIGSTDPQVDTIIIWRTLDGGPDLFFLTEIPAPPALGGVAQPWSFKDFLPDTSLNEFIPAPINQTNNPPPAGFLPMAYHFERIWGAVGNFVFASGGPDVLTGNPNESFSPSDFFEFPSPVTRIVPTATGILVFLTSDVYAILGGPVFSTFFPSPMVPGVGLLHYQALDIHGGVIYLYTADNQFIAMDPSGGAQRMGGAIADKLAAFDATKVYVTVHENGNDNAIFVSDGSTGWYRLNPSQFPNGTAVWSPFGTATNGAGAVQSIEVTNGIHRLLVGGVGSNKPILMRDFSTYQDNGTPYTCFFTMGSINLVSPGQIAGLTFVNIRANRVGTSPTCAYLLNEISGAFTTFPSSQAYPWQIYGATLQPTSLYSNAYYFNAVGQPSLAEHMQVKVSFPAENFANEVLSLTVYGTIEQPPEE